LFEKYGDVDSCQIVYDHATGRSRGFAFIYMMNVRDAEDAKEKLSGAELDGRRIRVDYSITQRAHTPTPGVYMGQSSGRSSGYRGSNYRSDYRSGGGYGGGGSYRRRSRSR